MENKVCESCKYKEKRITKLKEEIRRLSEREAHRIASDGHFFGKGDEW